MSAGAATTVKRLSARRGGEQGNGREEGVLQQPLGGDGRVGALACFCKLAERCGCFCGAWGWRLAVGDVSDVREPTRGATLAMSFAVRARRRASPDAAWSASATASSPSACMSASPLQP
jgi:hypothetical protein